MMDFSFSRERRLIFQKTVEVPHPLSQRIADFMRRNGTDPELERLIVNVRAAPLKDKQTILDGALQHLQTFGEKERQLITTNLDSLEVRILSRLNDVERGVATEKVRSWLDRAREALAGKEIGEPSAATSENPAPPVPHTPAQMAMNFAEGVTNTILPTRLTENMTPSQKRMLGGALTVGTALLAGWMAYGLIKGSEGVRNVGRKIRNTFLWLLGGAAIAAGTYVGFQAWQNWGEIKKQMAAMQSTLDLATKATGEAKDKLMEKAEEMRKKIEEMTKTPAVSPMPEKTEPVSSVEKQEKTKGILIITEKEADRALERTGLELTGMTLLLMYKNRAEQVGIVQEAEKNAVCSSLNDQKIQRLTVSKLRTIRNLKEAAAVLPTDASEAEKKALYFLALVTRDLELRVSETLSDDGSVQIESLSLKEVIDRMHHVPKIFQRVQIAMNGKNWKDIGDVTEIFQAAFADESLADLQCDPLIVTELTNLGLKGKEAVFFNECITHGRSTLLREHVTVDVPEEDRKAVQIALTSIREKLISAETIAYLIKYVHNQKDYRYAETLEKHIRENLTVCDAVQLYAYLRLATKTNGYSPSLEKENPVGALLLQMKVIDLLGKANKELATRMQAFLVVEATKEINPITLPEGTREFLVTLLTKTGGTVVDLAEDKLNEHLQTFWIWSSQVYKTYPKRSLAGVTGVPGTAVLIGGRIAFLKWKQELAERVAERLANTSAKTKRPLIHRLTHSGVEAYKIGKSHTLATHINSVDDKIKAVADTSLKGALEKEYHSLFERKFTEKSFQRFYDDLNNLKTKFPAQAIDDIESHVRTHIHPFRKTLEIRRGAYLWEHAGRFAGLGMHAYMIYEDIGGLMDIQAQKDKMQDHAQNVMHEISDQITSNRAFEKIPGQKNTYRHIQSGVEINLKEIQQQVDTADDGFGDKAYAQAMRLATDVGSLGMTIRMGAKVFTGPWGMALAGAEITIRTGINAWEQGKMRQFIQDAPPWMLTLLGTQQTTGIKESDWLTSASSWMMSDLWKGGVDKQSTREKMLFTIFYHDLRTYAPELFADVTQGLDAPPLLDGLFDNHFKTIILPAFYIRLFAIADSQNISWNQTNKGDVHAAEGGWQLFNPINVAASVAIPPEVTFVQIRQAMRDASVLYAQHLHEGRQMELLRMREEAVASKDGVDLVFEGVISATGEKTVFGQKLSELTPEIIVRNNGKTRTELLIETLTKQVTNAPGDARSSKLAKRSNIFTVAPGTIAGLDNAFDAGNNQTIIDLIPDPVLREQLRRIIPETTEEKEGTANTSWKEWYKGESWKEWVQPATAYDRGTGADMATVAANFLQNELHAPSLAENTSLEAAARAITIGGTELLAQYRAKTPFQRDENLARILYERSPHQPLVFSRLHGKTDEHVQRQVDLCRQLRIPNTSQKEFDFEHVSAVFFEGMTLEGSGHDVVLATFVYMNPKDTPQVPDFLIVQQAAATSATRVHATMTGGMALASNATEFLVQTEAKTILEHTITGMRTQRENMEKVSKHVQETNARVITDWERTKANRDTAEKAQNVLREAALARAAVPGTIVYVPGAYERDELRRIFRLQEGNFAGTIDGTLISFAGSSFSSTPSMSAFSAEGSAPLRPSHKDRFRYTVNKDGQSRENIVVDLATAAKTPVLTRTLLTTPLDLRGHPRARDSRFVEETQKYELQRLLNLATYKKSFMWGAEEYKKNLFVELWPHYRDAKDKRIFLNTLMNNLLSEDEVSSAAYKRILRNMQREY